MPTLFIQHHINNGSDWSGISAYIAERSVINGSDFKTDFNTGHGLGYYIAGNESNSHEWSNINIQDILPTWQWWFDKGSSADTLKADFDYGTKFKEDDKDGQELNVPYKENEPFNGGASLVVYGSVSDNSYLHLYKTSLNVKDNTKVDITFKKTSSDTAKMQLGLVFADNTADTVKLDIEGSSLSSNSYVTKTVDLSAYAGKTVAAIGLNFAGQADKYQMNIGEINYMSGAAVKPAAPTGLKITKAFTTGEMNIAWDIAPYDSVKQYNVYAVINGKEMYMGGIYDSEYYIKSLYDAAGTVKLKVKAVGTDGTESDPATVTFDMSKRINNLSAAVSKDRLTVSFNAPAGVTLGSTDIAVKKEYENDDTEYKASTAAGADQATVTVPVTNGSRYIMTVTPHAGDGTALETVTYEGRLADDTCAAYTGKIVDGKLTEPKLNDWWKLTYTPVTDGVEETPVTIVRSLESMPSISTKCDGVNVVLTDYKGNISEKTYVANIMSITVSASADSLQVLQSQSLSMNAKVKNYVSDNRVTWSITGNKDSATTINNDGILFIGDNETAAKIIVTAKSVENPSVTGAISITIKPATEIDSEGSIAYPGEKLQFAVKKFGNMLPASAYSWSVQAVYSDCPKKDETGIDASGLLTVSSDEDCYALIITAADKQDSSVSYTKQVDLGYTKPIASPEPGTYASTQKVILSGIDYYSGIYYTLDGTEPTSKSNQYISPITVSADTTIKAKKISSWGSQPSRTAVFNYVINTDTPSANTVAAPHAAPPAGTYNEAQTVVLSSDTAGADIYFVTGDVSGYAEAASGNEASGTAEVQEEENEAAGSTDNADVKEVSFDEVSQNDAISENDTVSAEEIPAIQAAGQDTARDEIVTRGTKYTQPINVAESTVITAVAVKDGMKDSSRTSFDYTVSADKPLPVSDNQVKTPSVSPAPGKYSASQDIVLESATEGAEIYYLINSTENVTSANGIKYTGAFTISGDTVIKAIAVKNGMTDSEMAVYSYEISIPAPSPEPVPTPDTKVYYTVSFDSCGGTPVASEAVEKGTAISVPAEPTKDGYNFMGWYTKPNGNGNQYYSGRSVTSDLTLYAYWASRTSTGTNVRTDIAKATIKAIADKTYTGSAITPAVTVLYGKKKLTQGVDYEVAYSSNVNAGSKDSAAVTVYGTGIYTGSLSAGFTIKQRSIRKAVVMAGDSILKNGTASVNLVLSDGSRLLVTGKDYELDKTSVNTKGAVRVNITGKGNYCGNLKETVKVYGIDEKVVASVSIDSTDIMWTGRAVKPEIKSVRDVNGNELKGKFYAISYLNNKNAGENTALVIVKGKNGYKGKAIISFTISGHSMENECQINNIAGAEYSGSAVKPKVTVKKTSDSRKLKAGKDYTVSYRDNISAGTATVEVSGKGGYTGTITKTFAIDPVRLDKVSIKGVKNQKYADGKAVTLPGLKLYYRGKLMTQGRDYSVSYSDNSKKGRAQVKIDAVDGGNFTGSVQKTYRIK